jgi:hypothetical protein
MDGVLQSFAPAGLTKYAIPNSVTAIGDGAFDGCCSLTSITIPNSVTAIGDGAFYDCTSLANVKIGRGVTWIGPEAFYNCLSLREVVCAATIAPKIGEKVFYHDNGRIGCKIYVPKASQRMYEYANSWEDYYWEITGF